MKVRFCRTPEFWLSAAGTAGLAVLFVLWLASGPDVSPAGMAAAALSAVLAGAVFIRFVPAWMGFWRGGSDTAVIDGEPANAAAGAFVMFLTFDVLVLMLVALLRLALGLDHTFAELLEFWRGTDSRHYLDIAREWYLSSGSIDRLVQLVFLPGYPLLVRAVWLIVGNDIAAGLIVSALCFAASGSVIYRLLRLDMPHGEAMRTLKYICILPGSFFFAAPMSESLFLLLCSACIYLARTRRWVLGCLCGGAAAFTRSTALALLVPLVFELVAARRSVTGRQFACRCASMALVLAGFGAYMAVNWAVSGDPLKFMEYQHEHWSQNFGLFFNTPAYQLDQAAASWEGIPQNTLGLWIPNLIYCFAALIFMALAAKNMRASYTAWFIAYYFVAIGATWLLSAPRYLIALLPVPLSVSMAARTTARDGAITAVSALLAILYLYAFVMRWQVW